MRLPNIRTLVLKRVTITSRYNSDTSKVLLVILKYITAGGWISAVKRKKEKLQEKHSLISFYC